MSPLGALAITGAGFWAGAINTVVGSGSLVTYPVLVALGYSPIVANVSNTIGLVPGSFSGAYGYRRELAGQRGRVLWLGVYALAGGLTGGALLLAAPDAFKAVVPALILLAALLMAIQPRLAAWLRRHHPSPEGGAGGVQVLTPHAVEHRVLLPVLVFATAIYGGYFGAAQGVILLALLGLLVDDSLQRLNGLKNVLAGLVNAIAAVLFITASHPAWGVAGILAISSIVGAQFGAAIARRIPDRVLRAVVVVGGITVGIILAVR